MKKRKIFCPNCLTMQEVTLGTRRITCIECGREYHVDYIDSQRKTIAKKLGFTDENTSQDCLIKKYELLLNELTVENALHIMFILNWAYENGYGVIANKMFKKLKNIANEYKRIKDYQSKTKEQ